MDQELKDQIRSKMQEKDTQELIAIWKKNDRTEWHEETFDVIREVLMERTGELPAQGLDADADTPSAAEHDEDERDVSYNYDRLTAAAHWASNLSWLFLGVGVVMSGSELLYVFLNRASFNAVTIIASLALWCMAALLATFFFVLLQIIAEGVWLLIDIEDNTRNIVKRQMG